MGNREYGPRSSNYSHIYVVLSNKLVDTSYWLTTLRSKRPYMNIHKCIHMAYTCTPKYTGMLTYTCMNIYIPRYMCPHTYVHVYL